MNDAIDGHLHLSVYYKSMTGQLIINVLYVEDVVIFCQDEIFVKK